jgi:choice-of-anchor A domain-containing protein
MFGTLAAFGLLLSSLATAAVPQPPREYDGHQELLERSRQYTLEMKLRNPGIGVILDKLGLQYLHQLDPAKAYNLNVRTGEVTVLDARSPAAPAKVNPLGIDFGFMSNTARVWTAGSGILGKARTVVTCPFSAQTAAVSGFMASTVSRAPIAGISNGVLMQDSWLDSVSEVNFMTLKVAGGARNPMNRTAMETTHTGSCGDDLRIANLVSTWPPLRIDMVIDDTGSMGNALSGVQAALSSFIASQNQDPLAQRGVSYELISFKDAPSLRLANTEDASAATAAVQSLFPAGGDECPEDSIGGLNMALGRMSADEDAEGFIVLATDASPNGGDVGGVIAAARAAGIRVHVMLSGDCVEDSAAGKAPADVAADVSAREVFKRIADETGGLFFYLPDGTSEDYANILSQIFNWARIGGGGEPPTACLAIDLDDYTLFLREDYTEGHDVRGKVAAGGNITLTHFSVGGALPDSGKDHSLVAGGNLSLSRGAVFGNAFYGGSYSANSSVVYPRGTVAHGTPIDFASRFAQLSTLSSRLGSMTATGTTKRESWGGLLLSGTDPAVNVFRVDASAFTGAKLLSLNAPAGSLVVINIHGTSATFTGFGHTFSGGINQHGVLYNFVDATSINAHGFGFFGTMLAPQAHVTFNNGSWDGSIYARSLTGNAGGHHNPLNHFEICR